MGTENSYLKVKKKLYRYKQVKKTSEGANLRILTLRKLCAIVDRKQVQNICSNIPHEQPWNVNDQLLFFFKSVYQKLQSDFEFKLSSGKIR